MKNILRYSFVALMAMFGLVANADVTDELTWDKLIDAGNANNYVDFSGKSATSKAVYAGQISSGTDNYIQLRTKNNNSGIVSITSGGKVKSVTITFNSKTTDRSISIYGSNTAYTTAADLYDESKFGTKLGDIAANADSKTLTVTGDYTFIGLRSADGAIYVDKVAIVWDGEAGNNNPDPQTSETPTVDNIAAFAALGNGKEGVLKLDGAKVTYVSPDGKSVYVRDATGGMCFYNQSAMSGASNKWQLGGSVKGKVNIYNNMTQINVTDPSALIHTEGDEYAPVAVTMAELKDHVADLVKLTDDFTVTEVDSKFYNNENKDVQLFDNFKLKYEVKAGDVLKNVTGVVILYKTQVELAPTVAPSTATGIQAIMAEQAEDAIYNLAGQRVEKATNGVFIQNGKKFVVK